jgi:hypothetical protein
MRHSDLSQPGKTNQREQSIPLQTKHQMNSTVPLKNTYLLHANLRKKDWTVNNNTIQHTLKITGVSISLQLSIGQLQPHLDESDKFYIKIGILRNAIPEKAFQLNNIK